MTISVPRFMKYTPVPRPILDPHLAYAVTNRRNIAQISSLCPLNAPCNVSLCVDISQGAKPALEMPGLAHFKHVAA